MHSFTEVGCCEGVEKNELRHRIKTSFSLAVIARLNQNESVFSVSFFP